MSLADKADADNLGAASRNVAATEDASSATVTLDSDQSSPEARAFESSMSDPSAPWIAHLPMAWRLSFGNHHLCSLPSDPTDVLYRASQADWRYPARAWEFVAWWAPLLHLTTVGLGWTRPDWGLNNWRRAGFDQASNILDFIHRWYGGHRLLEFLAWAPASSSYAALAARSSFDPGSSGISRHAWDEPLEDDHELAEVRHIYPSPQWTRTWDSSWPEEMLGVPAGASPFGLVEQVSRSWSNSHETPSSAMQAFRDGATMTVLSPRYVGGADLPTALLAAPVPDDVERVDIICKPVGWLGSFRKSPVTGIWFRDDVDHDIHLLGYQQMR